MADTLQTLTDELNGLAGLDLEGDEPKRLLNEADMQFCTRGEWTRATLELGPAVTDQAAYDLPASVYKPLKVWVDGIGYAPSSEDAVRDMRSNVGATRLAANGAWWLSFAADGTEQLSIFPTPSEGQSLECLAVIYPAEMEDPDDPPSTPKGFRRGLIEYARLVTLGELEDDDDLRGTADAYAEREAQRLRRHRLGRTGRGPVTMRIRGVNA